MFMLARPQSEARKSFLSVNNHFFPWSGKMMRTETRKVKNGSFLISFIFNFAYVRRKAKSRCFLKQLDQSATIEYYCYW